MKGQKCFWACWVAAVAALPLVASAAAFTNGNMVVIRSGDEAYASAGNNAAPAYLDEYDFNGDLVQSIPMGDYSDTLNPQFTYNGGEGKGGFISRSYDGNYLVLGGYSAVVGSAAVLTSTNARLVARVDMSGNIDTSTKVTDISGNEIRTVASYDGNQFWFGGTGNSNQVRYTTLGSTGTSTRIATSSNTGSRAINIFRDAAGDAQLYYSRSGGGKSVSTLTRSSDPNPKLPVTGTATLADLFSNSGASPYDFFMLNDSTLYITDDNATAIGGVQKWTRSGTTWTRQYVLQAGLSYVPLRGLSGCMATIEGNDYPVLVATDGNGALLYKLVDTGPGATWDVLAAAPANTLFHDVVLPYSTPEPATLVLIGLGGLFCLRRRCRA
jgi:hypothetical protein